MFYLQKKSKHIQTSTFYKANNNNNVSKPSFLLFSEDRSSRGCLSLIMSALKMSLSRNGEGPMWDYSRGGLHSANIHEGTGYKHWPYPEPIEKMTAKLTNHPLFYKSDGSHKRVDGMTEGKTQPVTNPNADPNPAKTQYRVLLRDAHKHVKHNFMNSFLFNYRFQMHKFSAKKDARACAG